MRRGTLKGGRRHRRRSRTQHRKPKRGGSGVMAMLKEAFVPAALLAAVVTGRKRRHGKSKRHSRRTHRKR